VCAALFLIVLFALYYLSAHDPKLGNHSDELFSLFQILTTGLTGVLVAKRQPGDEGRELDTVLAPVSPGSNQFEPFKLGSRLAGGRPNDLDKKHPML
jgi:hypothetical protein